MQKETNRTVKLIEYYCDICKEKRNTEKCICGKDVCYRCIKGIEAHLRSSKLLSDLHLRLSGWATLYICTECAEDYDSAELVVSEYKLEKVED